MSKIEDMSSTSTLSSIEDGEIMSSTLPQTILKMCIIWTAIKKSKKLPPACEKFIPKGPEDSLYFEQFVENLKKGNDIFGIKDPNGESTNYFERTNYGFHYRYPSRSLPIIGILGGIVLLLLITALTTCMRNRKNILLERHAASHETFARQILIDHIRHLSSNNQRRSPVLQDEVRRADQDRPPSYEDVVKPDAQEEVSLNEVENVGLQSNEENLAQPPSYCEAMEALQESKSGNADNFVTTIDISTDPEQVHVVQIESDENHDRSRSSATGP